MKVVGAGIFVLQSCLDEMPSGLSMPDRMAGTLAHAGVSVTVASLTNFAAFAIGSNTSLPALRAFSLYAAFALLFNLILQASFVIFFPICRKALLLLQCYGSRPVCISSTQLFSFPLVQRLAPHGLLVWTRTLDLCGGREVLSVVCRSHSSRQSWH